MMQNIEINIEEVVLHGFAPGDKRRIGEALEIALTQALSEKGITRSLNQSMDIPFTDAGSFPLQVNSKPATVGASIASSIHSQLIAVSSQPSAASDGASAVNK
jgi:hypothetical protein